ncbi:hypothetical protein OH492_19750 [Vibrio chagasii]|nr:hypothetical protein [Vibrio chagasii]
MESSFVGQYQACFGRLNEAGFYDLENTCLALGLRQMRITERILNIESTLATIYVLGGSNAVLIM